MAQDTHTTHDRPGDTDRRRYNRRTTSGDPSPPYYAVFERIAAALEGIQVAMGPTGKAPGTDGPKSS